MHNDNSAEEPADYARPNHSLNVNDQHVSVGKHLVKNVLSATDIDFLSHMDNVSRRRVACAYFGRFRDESGINYVEGKANLRERCLAIETNNRTEVRCPFFSLDLESKCSYKPGN